MKVSAQYASTHFEELSTAVDAGEVVEIERPEKAALRLVRVERAAEVAPAETGKRILGAGKAKLRIPSDEEWAEMDREMWADFLNDDLQLTERPARASAAPK